MKIVHKNKMNPVADDDNDNDWKSSAMAGAGRK